MSSTVVHQEEKNVLYGGPDIENFDLESRSLGEAAIKKLREYGDDVIFVDAKTNESLTARQFLEKSTRLAECMQHEGIKVGDVVGILSENRLEFPIAAFAALYLGVTVAPLNTTYVEDELNHAINLSKPKIVFSSSNCLKNIAKVAAKNTFIKKIILLNGSSVFSKGVVKLDTYLNDKKIKSSGNFQCPPVDYNETIVSILCSSGTTGLPKGVQLSQTNYLTAISQIYSQATMTKQVLGVMSILSVIPWFHTYGFITMYGIVFCGNRCVTLSKYDNMLFLRTIQDHKINAILGVPPLLLLLAKHPAVDDFDMSSLFVILCGAAPLSKEVEDAVTKRINVMAIRQGFGMSESTLSVLQQDDEHSKPGSIGSLRPGTWGKIIEPETGKILGVGERGEMCFKGSAIMKGYINNEAATKDTIDADGWLHTGDIGYYDEDQEWFIVDRIKELIKYKGYQVPPAEVEALLLQHPKLVDAAVIGIPDDAAGEVAYGFVVKAPGAQVTEQEVLDFVADKMSYAKRLHGGVRFVEVIPRNATGKILRRELRDLMKNERIKSKL